MANRFPSIRNAEDAQEPSWHPRYKPVASRSVKVESRIWTLEVSALFAEMLMPPMPVNEQSSITRSSPERILIASMSAWVGPNARPRRTRWLASRSTTLELVPS